MAAVLTGCAVAGIAVVFAELVEGIGCLLGGFCLSMWCEYKISSTLKDARC